ncbi:MAG: DUF2723 domain-containing protein [Gemmatimonadales bacterium]
MTNDELKPPYLAAAIVSAAVLGLYVLTLAPTAQMWDTSEYIAAAKVLGIPHPPGNPLFVLIAKVWGLIPLAAHYAMRINLLAAVTSAVASGFLFLVAERHLRAFLPVAGTRLAAAAAGILVGAASFTVWNQSVVNEKVYTVSLLFNAAVLWLAGRWADTPEGPGRDRLLLMMGYLMVFGSTNHMLSVLAAPAVLLYMGGTDPRALLRSWVVVFAVLGGVTAFTLWMTTPGIALIVGALIYAFWRERDIWRQPIFWVAILTVVVGISLNYVFLPIRAGLLPPINEGEPTNWQALLDVLNREQYQKPPVTQRMANFGSQVSHYWQYVTWQFGRDWPHAIRRFLALLFVGLGVWGGIQQWRRDRRAAIAMTGVYVTLTILLVFYLNFRYGFSIHPNEPNLDREVRERDYFFIASFQTWGVWVALGLADLWHRARRLLSRVPDRRAWLATSPVLLIALIPLVGNDAAASRRGETLARDFARDILESVEPYAILITAGDNDMFPLWYAQEVEGIRRDVLLANLSLMNTDWHVRQLVRRDVDPFDPSTAAELWRDRNPPYPEGRPLGGMTVAQVDSLPVLFEVPRPTAFRAGDSLSVQLPPGRYERAQLLSLRLVQENMGRRPVYFALTTGGAADRLGLGTHMLGAGFVRKVMPSPVVATDSIVLVQGLGWMDLGRSRQLLFATYNPAAATRTRPFGWIDTPSENILTLYAVSYQAFSAGARTLWPGHPEARVLADSADAILNAIIAQTSFGRPADQTR